MLEARVPDAVRSRYSSWSWGLVARRTRGLQTWRLTGRDDAIYVKVAPISWFPRLTEETAKLRWARAHLPVPEVLDAGTAGDVDWLVTRSLPGVDATTPRVTADPERLVPLLAEGLRRFHEAPAASCPFDFRLDVAMAQIRLRAEAGLVLPERDFHADHGDLSLPEALDRLEELRPASEDPVICHGDYCPPNILIDDWRVSGFLDLGELGIADRWWDLAIGTWSATWNYGPGWEELFLHTYGVERDDSRIQFYRLLYDLAS